MTRTSFRVLASFVLCAAVTTGTAFARDHDRGRDGGRAFRQSFVRNHDRDRDFARDRRREAREHEWRRNHRRNAMFDNNGQPNGWTRGRKTGWHNCDLPPGQAKKHGCNSTWHRPHHRDFWFDPDHDGDRD